MPGLTRQARQLDEYSPQQIKRQAALEEYGSPPAYEEPSPASRYKRFNFISNIFRHSNCIGRKFL